jgi:hypothetical protein
VQHRTRRLPPRSRSSIVCGPIHQCRTSPATNCRGTAQIADIARDKPAIDLEILFEYNSAEIGPKTVPTLVALGNARCHGRI